MAVLCALAAVALLWTGTLGSAREVLPRGVGFLVLLTAAAGYWAVYLRWVRTV
jgi:hypothetical protein